MPDDQPPATEPVPADAVPADGVPADGVPADAVPADAVPAGPVPADAGAADGTAPGAELLAAAEEIIAAAAAAGATLRLLGGIAVYHLAPSARSGALARSYHDFDVVVASRQKSLAARTFRAAGYSEDQLFNALHGAHRMIFSAPRGFVVDVVVGDFQMCHRLELGRDLPGDGITIRPADLLLTKLQIVRIEDKDLADTAALLLDLQPDAGSAGLDTDRFVAPLAADWGFYHTVEQNLPRVAAWARGKLGDAEADAVAAAASRLTEAMDAAPKSLRWKMRARVGEKVTWYELPEEIG